MEAVEFGNFHIRIREELKVIEFGNQIAKDFRYVRVDFYELEGRMYFSEITLYHGAGYNKFHPEEYEAKYARMLKLQ